MVYRLMVLNKPDTATPIGGRVAGDAMDAAMLATSLASGNIASAAGRAPRCCSS